jgi:hypothetical protein
LNPTRWALEDGKKTFYIYADKWTNVQETMAVKAFGHTAFTRRITDKRDGAIYDGRNKL